MPDQAPACVRATRPGDRGSGISKVSYDRKLVKDAPSIDTDGELPAADEEAIFRHYDLAYAPALAVSGGWPVAQPAELSED